MLLSFNVYPVYRPLAMLHLTCCSGTKWILWGDGQDHTYYKYVHSQHCKEDFSMKTGTLLHAISHILSLYQRSQLSKT